MRRVLSFCLFISLLASCAEPGGATRTGALGGGAVGAGLGAIIGSQTGDAGTGVAIGAMAGAGAGAAIGNAFDARDAAIRNQDEAIARQEQLLRVQQKEIRDLREISQDSGNFHSSSDSPRASYQEPFGRPSRPGMVRVPAGPLKIPAHLRPETQASTTTRAGLQNSKMMAYDNSFQALRPPTTEATIDTFEAREKRMQAFHSPEAGTPVRQPVDITPETYGNGRDSLDDSVGAVQPAFYGAADDAEVKSPEPMRDSIEESTITLEEEAPQKGFEEIKAGQTFEEPQQQPAALAPVKVDSPGLDSTECREAESEIRQAKSSSDTADQLFYYRRALRLCPDNSAYHAGMGNLYLSLDRSEDARFEFSEALRLDPTNESASEGLKSLSKGSDSNVAGAIITGTSAERY